MIDSCSFTRIFPSMSHESQATNFAAKVLVTLVLTQRYTKYFKIAAFVQGPNAEKRAC